MRKCFAVFGLVVVSACVDGTPTEPVRLCGEVQADTILPGETGKVRARPCVPPVVTADTVARPNGGG